MALPGMMTGPDRVRRRQRARHGRRNRRFGDDPVDTPKQGPERYMVAQDVTGIDPRAGLPRGPTISAEPLPSWLWGARDMYGKVDEFLGGVLPGAAPPNVIDQLLTAADVASGPLPVKLGASMLAGGVKPLLRGAARPGDLVGEEAIDAAVDRLRRQNAPSAGAAGRIPDDPGLPGVGRPVRGESASEAITGPSLAEIEGLPEPPTFARPTFAPNPRAGAPREQPVFAGRPVGLPGQAVDEAGRPVSFRGRPTFHSDKPSIWAGEPRVWDDRGMFPEERIYSGDPDNYWGLEEHLDAEAWDAWRDRKDIRALEGIVDNKTQMRLANRYRAELPYDPEKLVGSLMDPDFPAVRQRAAADFFDRIGMGIDRVRVDPRSMSSRQTDEAIRRMLRLPGGR